MTAMAEDGITETERAIAPHEQWDKAVARDVIEKAAQRYIAGCRARLEPFIDRHFSLKGSLKLHRLAVGWDLLKAPYNVVVAVPQLMARLMAAGAGAAG